MSRLFIFLFFLLTSSVCVYSQVNTDYNIRGDQALEKEDYQGARTWFSEGLPDCNLYSIQKLTRIWGEQPSMQQSLYRTMRRCFNCIKSLAEGGNQEAMRMLSEYYREGVGIEENIELANYWHAEFGASYGFTSVENDVQDLETEKTVLISKKKKKSILSDKFYSFVAYTHSPTMPFSATIGGFSKFGFYVSYKTSEPRNHDFECNNTEVINTDLITDLRPLYRFEQEKWTGKMITGGILLPLKREKFYFSLGGGYAERNYFRQIVSDETIIDSRNSAWCHNTEASYQSIVIEAGGLFKWRKLILTGGVNSTGFKDLDVYIGLGITF